MDGLTVALMDHGWELRTVPSGNYLQRGEDILNPNELAPDVQSGKLAESAWAVRVAELGIGELKLAGG